MPPRSITVLLVEIRDPLQPFAARDHAAAARKVLRTEDHIAVVEAENHRQLYDEMMRVAPDLVVPCVAPGSPDEVPLIEFLELTRTPFLGSSSATRRLCSDKVATKHTLARAGLAGLPHYVIGRRSITNWGIRAPLEGIAAELEGNTGVIIKPVRGAGALGVKLWQGGGDLAGSIISALNYDSEVMLEPFVLGQELSVIVLGPAADPEVFGVAEVVEPLLKHERELYNWVRSFQPAVNVSDVVLQNARSAYTALGCEGGAVVDFVIDSEGRSLVLEVDTALDFTTDGRVACAAASDDRMTLDAMHSILRAEAGQAGWTVSPDLE